MQEPSREEPRRSIQDVIPPARSRPIRVSPAPIESNPLPPRGAPPPIMPKVTHEQGPWGIYAVIVGVILIMGGVAVGVLSTVFHRAHVTVTPYRFDAALSASFQSSPNSTTLPYQSVSVRDTGSKTIPATGKEQASERASGTIVVYNAYSTSQQRLITNTRFQTPDGLIFRVHSPIVVPGYTIKAGVKVPGSIEVTVYADEPGEKYNIGLSDFTLPGLKDPAQFKLIYAKSKTPISGGFVGERAVVDPALRREAIQDLEAELDRSLRMKLSELTPPKSIVFESAVSIIYAPAQDTLKDDKSATIVVSGTAVAPAFPVDALIAEFTRVANIHYSGSLTIENPNELSVIVDPPQGAISGGPLTVSVSGTVRLVASFSKENLARDLAGKIGRDISTIRANYPEIESMNVKVYPFWRGTVPKNPARVKIEMVEESGESI